MNKLKGLIKCGNCGYTYTHLKENGISKYICNGYRTQKTNCNRRVVNEKDIMFIINEYCKINKLISNEYQNNIKSIVKQIIIDEYSIEINYHNGHKSILNENGLKI